MHWHSETFSLPKNSIKIASGKVCKNQGFTYGVNVIALQFNFEMTDKIINSMLEKFSKDLQSGEYIQKKEEVLQQLHLLEN